MSWNIEIVVYPSDNKIIYVPIFPAKDSIAVSAYSISWAPLGSHTTEEGEQHSIAVLNNWYSLICNKAGTYNVGLSTYVNYATQRKTGFYLQIPIVAS